MLLRTIVPDHIKGLKYYTYAHVLEEETHPFYIGIGTIQHASKYQRAKNSINRNKFWKNYTKNRNYLVIICSESENKEIVKEQEKEMISILGKKIDDGDNYLVNISDGGDGCNGYKHTKEHIEWLKHRYAGKNNPMYGKKASNETRLKMSESRKGRVHSEYTKHLLSVKKKERGYQGKYGKDHPTSRQVYKLDSNNFTIIEKFDTLKEAAVNVNVCAQAIGKSCKLLHKIGGYNWAYVNTYDINTFLNQKKKVYKKDVYKQLVCDDFNDGISKAEIARKYKIGETTVARIISNNLNNGSKEK